MTKEQKSYKINSLKAYPERSRVEFIRTFGCQMNDADSEVMERPLERQGYKKIDSSERVDVIILNKST